MNMNFKNLHFIKITLFLLAVVSIAACQTTVTKTHDAEVSKSDLSTEVKQKYAYALQLMGAGNDAAALKMLNDVSDLNNSLSGPYVNRGLIYLRLNDKVKAEQQFREAIGRNAKNVTALNQLGILLREKKDFSGARTNYEAALAINENHVNAHLNLGILCDIYLQDKACAMQHFEAYLALNGDDEAVINWVVDLKEQL
ncbi:MAG: tetratricopeptide repeat protein [Gammaproteobacteria bacterium]|nr:tetratricopeptide repeat protein [Gammaproteobacteria bacterium]